MSRPLVALVLATLLLTAPALAQSQRWVVVHGKGARLLGGLSWDRMAKAYLGRLPHEIVDDRDPAASRVPSSRFLIGTPKDNPAVVEAAKALGMQVKGGRLFVEERELPDGMGMRWSGKDPDGRGRLVLFAGNDAEGVYSTFTRPCRIHEDQRSFTRRHQLITDFPKPLYRTEEPFVVRLDHDHDRLLASAKGAGEKERLLRVARGLAGYLDVFQAALGPQLDLLSFIDGLSADPALAKAREFAASRDLEAELAKLWKHCSEAVGGATGARPVYYLLYGAPQGTNAKTFGFDPVTGRPRVLLNLCRLCDVESFEIAVLHESAHVLQPPMRGSRLVDQAINEGVATLISKRLRPETPQPAVMMWSEAEWQAAEAQRAALLAAFLKITRTSDAALRKQWFTLGVPNRAVPGAPSRCGYYLGYLAAEAWMAQDEKRGLGDLLRAPADEVFRALSGL